MKPDEHLRFLAEQLTRDIAANGDLSRATRNPALIGAFAEATVRRLVRDFVAPLNVSHGSIVYEENLKTKKRSEPPEIDTVIWKPCPLPPIFANGDFALVPRGSAFGMMEIKSSDYSGSIDAIERVLKRQGELMSWAIDLSQITVPPALGVICVRQKKRNPKLDRLIKEKLCVQLLVRKNDDEYEPCVDSFYVLVNFLVATRCRARMCEGVVGIPWEKHKPVRRE